MNNTFEALKDRLASISAQERLQKLKIAFFRKFFDIRILDIDQARNWLENR